MNQTARENANGAKSVQEQDILNELMERERFVKKAVEACKKTIVFPIGVNKISCYSYTDSAGEYESWGECTQDGIFTCWCNWGREHIVGCCNLTSAEDVFQVFENEYFKDDLKRFLEEQIRKAGIVE